MTWTFLPYRLTLARPYAWAKGVHAVRSGLLVACEMEGATGWGEVAPPPHSTLRPEAIAEHARRTLRVALAQDDVPAALDAAGCGSRLRAGVAGAWLDATARLAGKPLAAHVAGRLGITPPMAHRIPANALIPALAPHECAAEAVRLLEAGFATIKVKSDGDAGRDGDRLRAIRDAAGDKVRLRLDANESYAPGEALDALRALARHELEYVEQPVPATERAELVQLLTESPVPVALDESVTSWGAVAPLAHLDPILILKPQRVGGIDRTAALIARAAERGLRCIVTNSLETAVGRAHAAHAAFFLPEPMPACGLATDSLVAEDVASLPADRGFVAVPPGPGLGLAPSLEVLGGRRLA